MNIKKNEKISLGFITSYLILSIKIAFNLLSSNEFIIWILLNLGCLLVSIICRRTEAKLHEIGHCISILIIGKLMNLHCVPKISEVECDGVKIFRTSSNIDDILKAQRKYSFIRFYSLSGFLFIVIISTSACFVSYFMHPHIFYAILGISVGCMYLEIVALTNERPTNDLNMFLHPEKF